MKSGPENGRTRSIEVRKPWHLDPSESLHSLGQVRPKFYCTEVSHGFGSERRIPDMETIGTWSATLYFGIIFAGRTWVKGYLMHKTANILITNWSHIHIFVYRCLSLCLLCPMSGSSTSISGELCQRVSTAIFAADARCVFFAFQRRPLGHRWDSDADVLNMLYIKKKLFLDATFCCPFFGYQFWSIHQMSTEFYPVFWDGRSKLTPRSEPRDILCCTEEGNRPPF